MCVLFHLICNLQVLRLRDFAQVFQIDSDVGSVLSEHLRIRRHLRIISHRYRAFIICCLILITGSQFTSLLITTKATSALKFYKAGELAVSVHLSIHEIFGSKRLTHCWMSALFVVVVVFYNSPHWTLYIITKCNENNSQSTSYYMPSGKVACLCNIRFTQCERR